VRMSSYEDSCAKVSVCFFALFDAPGILGILGILTDEQRTDN
jgi:hypothetical protein